MLRGQVLLHLDFSRWQNLYGLLYIIFLLLIHKFGTYLAPPSIKHNLPLYPIPQKSSMSSQLGAIHSSRGINSEGVSRKLKRGPS